MSVSVVGTLHTRRCARHVAREAAARCPGCGEFFCRECVVEHAGRLLCSACLSRTAVVSARRRERWPAIRRGAATVGAGIVWWAMFTGLGALLVKIPPDYHDGTIWKKLVERARP